MSIGKLADKLSVPCPKCKAKIPLDKAVPGTTYTCVCGAEIKFTGDDGRKARQALDRLDDALKKLGKK